MSSVGNTRHDAPKPPPSRDTYPFLDPPQPPDTHYRLAGFPVVKLLGEGGMGCVFLAHDRKLKRHLAIKVVKADPRTSTAEQEAARQRFEREMQAAAAIDHPHVITIYGTGEQNGLPYVIMPYLGGETLQARLKHEPVLPVGEACRIALEAAEGLAAAHEAGHIHRDIKPGNLLLDGKQTQVKILDFGLARSIDDVTLTATGAVMGTPAYMAPEQARDAKRADHRADLFSLGCVLYEMLAGRQPFVGENYQAKLLAVAMDEPTPLRELNAAVPPELAALTHQLLEKKPASRPASAAAVADALRKWATPAPKPSRTPPAEVDLVALTPTPAPAVPVTPTPPGRSRNAPGSTADTLPQPASVAVPRRRRFSVLLGLAGLILPVCAGVTYFVATWPRPEPSPTPEAPKPPRPLQPVVVRPVEPKRLDCTGKDGLTREEVERAQQEWAKYLGTPVEITDDIDGVRMEFVLVPPGKFLMGSPADEPNRDKAEAQHEVVLTTPFYLGKYEVTQQQYEKVTGSNPSYFAVSGGGKEKVEGMDTPRFPVQQVSWDEATDYAKSLTRRSKNGHAYRLPSEAEWEYACRGGRSSSQPFGIGDGRTLSSTQANFDGNYPYGGADKGPYLERPCPVGAYRLQANALGLYDMHGNVWEWCADWYGDYPEGKASDPKGPLQGSDRVGRGGGWFSDGRLCRAAYRGGSQPGDRGGSLGFRLARSSPSGSSE
jgi:formylglycine-generating enzyme required for sulfatase activity/serine/threonine protein kinase